MADMASRRTISLAAAHLLACTLALATTSVPAATLQGIPCPGGTQLQYHRGPDGGELLLYLNGSIVLWRRTDGFSESLAPGSGASLSSNDRYLAFRSRSADLVEDDPNGDIEDVFFRDLATGATERIASATNNSQSGIDYWTGVSDDGRVVFFTSTASDLVPDDTNDSQDIFAYDRQTGAIERVNVGYQGQQDASLPSYSYQRPSVSADGRYVAFASAATWLVPGGTNGRSQAFVRDRLAQTTYLASVNSLGAMASKSVYYVRISGDGRYVVFTTRAPNFLPGASTLMQVYLRDLVAGTTQCISAAANGEPGDADSTRSSLTHDARYVAFITSASNFVIDDDRLDEDIYVKDRSTGSLTRVTLTTTGERLPSTVPDRCAVSADGRFVAMESHSYLPSQYHISLWDRDGLYDVPQSCWAFEAIAGCFDAGIVSGFADGAYGPAIVLDRAQMAVYVVRALAGAESNVPVFTATPTFPDVPADNWALKYIEYAVDEGIVAGYDDELYHPEYSVDRAQMAVYIARSLVAPSGEAGLAAYVPSQPRDFPDASTGFWAYKHIEYCVEHGIVNGYDDGLYHPEYAVTRDQMAVYIARAFGLM